MPVSAGKALDEGRGVSPAAQLQCRQLQPCGPSLGPRQHPEHVSLGQLRARLVGEEVQCLGRWFVWDTSDSGPPLLLVAGGSGVVPLRAILRHRQCSGSDVPVRLLYSSRTLADLIYRRELDHYGDGAQVSYKLTRSQPPGWTGYSGRVDAAMLAEIAWPASQQSLAFVCGPTRFVETVAGKLVALGYPAGRVKTERFGGT